MRKSRRGPVSIMENPAVGKQAVSLLVAGASKSAVARAVGTSRQTIGRWESKEEVQTWIEEETQRYLESLPDSLSLSKNVIAAGRKESEKLLRKKPGLVDHKVLEMATREGESMRRSIGIIPSQSPSVVIANIYNDNRQTIISPQVQELLNAHLGNVLDVELEGAGGADGEETGGE